MKRYKLIALDIIEGLDDEFYVVDINGIIGNEAINQFEDIFINTIKNVFHSNHISFIESSLEYDHIERLNPHFQLPVQHEISNRGIGFEDKMVWRKKFNISSPPIDEDIKFHHNKNYPQYLLKPNFAFKGRGIRLFNSTTIKKEDKKFVEQFIPSKLINDHCYSIRVIIVVGEGVCHPILYLNRICCTPIIKNLKEGELSTEESLSYISNRCDNYHYEINKSVSLKEFIKKIDFTIK